MTKTKKAEAKKEYFGFLAIRKAAKGIPEFAFGKRSTVEEAERFWTGSEGDSQHESPGSPKTKEIQKDNTKEPDFTEESALTEALTKAVEFGLAQFQLIASSSVFPYFFQGIVVEGNVLKASREEGDIVRDNKIVEIYGLDEAQYLDLVKRRTEYDQMKAGLKNVPSAIFLSLVASFDTLIVEILGKMLRFQRGWLEKSGRSLPLSSLAQASSLDDLLEEAISDELYQFSRGSHDEQAKFIESQFGVTIRERWKRWPDYIEIFERRNLVAHGEPCFNKRYADICKKSGHKGSEKLVGDKVELRTVYLNQSLNVLVEFAVLLSFQLWRKSDDANEDKAFTSLNEAVFKFIQHSKHLVAERLAEFALSLKKTGVSEGTRLMLVVNRASALRHAERVDEAVALLGTEDWSASSEIFQICVAAVKADTAAFISLVPKVVGRDDIGARSFVDWPCFAFVRKDGEVRVCLEKYFGSAALMRMEKAVVEEASEDDGASHGDAESGDDITMH